MPPAQDPQSQAQPMNVSPAPTSDQQHPNASKTCTMVLPNLSFPLRSCCWHGSSVPLRISNTAGTRYDHSFMYTPGLVNQPQNIPQASDAAAAAASQGIWARMKAFVSHASSALGRRLRSVKDKLSAVRLRTRIFAMV
ncbi:hypothetical protein NLJ89_g604 [Agrocybe chaxingu]|uniref:Uncharacterized protein n=1 Tax=Agrocybe chaxingu TaxID=84603 RepID=A0A9W8TEN2_9AGAR|nr:hypothetical protein NLJ89_g604 [Agrocybe chaxingu]